MVQPISCFKNLHNIGFAYTKVRCNNVTPRQYMSRKQLLGNILCLAIVGIGIVIVTTRQLGRFNSSTVDTSSPQIISMSCVLFFVTEQLVEEA